MRSRRSDPVGTAVLGCLLAFLSPLLPRAGDTRSSSVGIDTPPERTLATEEGPPTTSPCGSGAISVTMAASEPIVAEGATGRIRIDRRGSRCAVVVHLRISGTAQPDSDYVLGGTEALDGSLARVTILEGREFAELTVEVSDDVVAEAEERIVLTVQEDPSIRVAAAGGVTLIIPQNDFVVTTTGDAGPGSLRQAILNANALEGPDIITFDASRGPFAIPQTIVLRDELPDLRDGLTIDGRIEGVLWKAVGVTVSGDAVRRVFRVPRDQRVTIRSLTIADGRARSGAGIASEGRLVVEGVTFAGNRARRYGGGLAVLGGSAAAINSTFYGNAARRGGGLAGVRGAVTITNCTFTDNEAARGGAVLARETLLVRNTILANSATGADCVVDGHLDPRSVRNLIESHEGCGMPISSADPILGQFGYYNGPTKTFPLGGGSPAINLGDNAAAVDEHGKPLVWDQRGNGDPRFVAGFTDLGAFEVQAHAVLTVDTVEDGPLRACTRSGAADCPLRGAIEIANASEKHDVIEFDPRVFDEPRTIVLTRPLPALTADVTIDAGGTAGVIVSGSDRFQIFVSRPGVRLILEGVTTVGDGPFPGETLPDR